MSRGPVVKESTWLADFLNAFFLRPVYREPREVKREEPRED